MSRWFPDVGTYEGIEQARKGGIAGALAFAATIVVGIGITMALGRYPGDVAAVTIPMFVGMFLELAVVLFTAWRFKIGKGLAWGSVTLLAFAVELVSKFENGTARVGWFLFYAAVAAGLINGVRGAWARRSMPSPETDYAEVFD